MEAWWQFIQLLATAQALSMRTGQTMMSCVETINKVYLGYESAEWLSMQMLATTYELAARSGGDMLECMDGLNTVLAAYERDVFHGYDD